MKKLAIFALALVVAGAAISFYAMTAEIPAPVQPVEKVLPNDKYIR